MTDRPTQPTLTAAIRRAKQECKELASRKADNCAELRRIALRMDDLETAIRVAAKLSEEAL